MSGGSTVRMPRSIRQATSALSAIARSCPGAERQGTWPPPPQGDARTCTSLTKLPARPLSVSYESSLRMAHASGYAFRYVNPEVTSSYEHCRWFILILLAIMRLAATAVRSAARPVGWYRRLRVHSIAARHSGFCIYDIS